MCIHEEVYKKIKSFEGRQPAFIAWVCPLLRPRAYSKTSMIFSEDEDVAEILFLIEGKAGFVLPKYNFTTYITIEVGQHFGAIDIPASIFHKFEPDELHDWMDSWYRHKDILRRQFTVMAMRNSDVLGLSIADLNRMRREFPEQYLKMFEDSLVRMRRALILKRKAIQICEEAFDEAVSQMSNQ